MKNVIDVKNITKMFEISKKQKEMLNSKERRKKAVDDVSFSVKKGEVFGLLGPNGAGKTTTLRIMATLMKPDKGECCILGKNVTDNAVDVRRNIGFLTGELQLDGFFTPDYLFDFFAKLYGVSDEKRIKRKEYLFEKFQISKYSQTKINKLSTGMKQKISLAISLVHDPEVIIFDEPTNGLDIIAAKVVADFLQELKLQGKTIIISTHIFSLIEKLCDRVGVLLEGKLLYCDYLSNINGTLEDKFFELYQRKLGDGQYE